MAKLLWGQGSGEGSSDGAFGEMKSNVFLIEMLITELPKNSAPDIYWADGWGWKTANPYLFQQEDNR